MILFIIIITPYYFCINTYNTCLVSYASIYWCVRSIGICWTICDFLLSTAVIYIVIWEERTSPTTQEVVICQCRWLLWKTRKQANSQGKTSWPATISQIHNFTFFKHPQSPQIVPWVIIWKREFRYARPHFFRGLFFVFLLYGRPSFFILFSVFRFFCLLFLLFLCRSFFSLSMYLGLGSLSVILCLSYPVRWHGIAFSTPLTALQCVSLSYSW